MESGDDVVILEYGFWKERFGSDTTLIGKPIALNGKSRVVVGVAPKSFNLYVKKVTTSRRLS